MKVFWSWQNDFSPRTCRHFVREALVEAIAAVTLELDLDDADRPSLDQDTSGKPGMVDISSTIFQKISESAVFVGDVTPIGRSETGKALPNPNVLVELGWALKAPGFERCIGLLNTASGFSVEHLPFDIRQRSIIQYQLAEEADRRTRSEVKKRLVKQLTNALRTNLGSHLAEQALIAPVPGVASSENNPSIWASASGEKTHRETVGFRQVVKYAIEMRPRSYIRVIPGSWPNGIPTVRDIEDLDDRLVIWPPHDILTPRDGNCGPTDEGFVRYWIGGRDGEGRAIVGDVAMYFDASGEFWILHGSAVVPHGDGMGFRAMGALRCWSRTMHRVFRLFDHFGASPVRRVEVGVTGVREAVWPPDLDGYGHTARKAEYICDEPPRREWSDAAQRAFLKKAFDGVRDLFSLGKTSDAEFDALLDACDPGGRAS